MAGEEPAGSDRVGQHEPGEVRVRGEDVETSSRVLCGGAGQVVVVGRGDVGQVLAAQQGLFAFDFVAEAGA
ncbi:hypothetical protein AB0L41_34860 [Amycolatopsis mediterranei]|uniref:hypothetical protein n=1 Tax=Amycolatopsis mediterranei TaxID=33910 RepID=UPI00341B4F86